MDNGQITAACMLDLTKGFDTISHELLVHKMYHYGFRGNILDWIKSYLSDRTQFVRCNNSSSEYQNIQIGIPQGTILGPVLFLIYINGFLNLTPESDIISYADDSTFKAHSNDLKELNTMMQDSLSAAEQWLHKNRLVANPNKSSFILLGHSSRINDVDLNLIFNDTRLPSCDNTKLLGVVIDSQLRWNEHVTFLLKKVSPKLGLLRRLSALFPSEVLSSLYISIIQPHIDYCLSVWGSCSQTNISSIQKVQNRAARIVTKCYDYSIRSSSLIQQLGWLNVTQRHIYFTCILMYKSVNNLISETISNRFSLSGEIHPYTTGFSTSNNLHVGKPKTNYMKRGLSYKGVDYWNELPTAIKTCENLNNFKMTLRKFLLNKQLLAP